MAENEHKEWIPFEEGEYIVEQAVLISAGERALFLDRPAISIFTGRSGRKQLTGRALVCNVDLVELLEDGEYLDLLMDLGEKFKYHLKHPMLTAGKVFSPDVKSHLQIVPREPWCQIPTTDFADRIAALQFIDKKD